jgi:hypothetical protein
MPCLDRVTGIIYDLGMINSIDPMLQLAGGFFGVAIVGALLATAGWAMLKADERKEAMPQLAADLDKTKTPTVDMYGPYIPPRPRMPRD